MFCLVLSDLAVSSILVWLKRALFNIIYCRLLFVLITVLKYIAFCVQSKANRGNDSDIGGHGSGGDDDNIRDVGDNGGDSDDDDGDDIDDNGGE